VLPEVALVKKPYEVALIKKLELELFKIIPPSSDQCARYAKISTCSGYVMFRLFHKLVEMLALYMCGPFPMKNPYLGESLASSRT
jgi:hypothetical protein